jgi:hypothetical protein
MMLQAQTDTYPFLHARHISCALTGKRYPLRVPAGFFFPRAKPAESSPEFIQEYDSCCS